MNIFKEIIAKCDKIISTKKKKENDFNAKNFINKLYSFLEWFVAIGVIKITKQDLKKIRFDIRDNDLRDLLTEIENSKLIEKETISR